jgi:NadR type nicotinamide-nucleotide adenylyltransferase
LTAIGEPVIYIERVNPISGTAIRKEPMKWFPQISRTFQPYFVKNILVIGTASEGKTTLVNDIAKYFNIPKTVEYGRIYMEQRNITDVDLVANDFHQFISGQYEEYKKAVMNAQRGITIQDTDNLVTLMYANAYAHDPDIDIGTVDYAALTHHAKSIQKYFNWDHIFVVRPANKNFVDDGSRYMKQASMSERMKNMRKLDNLIESFGYDQNKITYLTGGEFEKNFEIVRDYIQNLK